jgi:hypothetical protein
MITIYLYPNTVEARIWDPTIFTTRNREMYARPVTIYQGIDNPIQVRVRNQDQKLVNMNGYLLQADVQDPVNFLTVGSFAVIFNNISSGLGSFVIDKTFAGQLDQQRYKLTFKVIQTNTNSERPAYVDDNYGVPIDLIVRPGYYSEMTIQGEEDTSDFLTIDGGTV